MFEELDRLMQSLEEWRLSKASSICPSHQITAFHLTALTEEKFRVYALSGFLLKISGLKAHIQSRDDFFALEWALRSLTLPDQEFMLIEKLRNSWSETTATKANNFLKELSNYYHVRDLVVCTKRGGYLLEMPSKDVFYFKDNPNWIGISDVKSRIISEIVSAERNVMLSTNPEAFTLDRTSAYEDFPHSIRGTSYSSSDFWSIWKYIWRVSSNRILDDCKIRNYGSYAATTETKELGILIMKRKLIDSVFETTGVSKATVSMFLQWMMLNSNTPRKFSLFHCPLVEINEKFVLIAPNVILMAHPPTIFLRQLAHNDKKLYDACSKSLEKQTLCRLKSHIEAYDRIIRIGLKLDTPDGETELDIVEYDKSQSVLSIAQAKLTIRPDSVSEVDHTNEVLAEGVEQLRRNRDLFDREQSNLATLLAKIGVDRKSRVNIMYFLLPTKSAPSEFLNIPSWIMILPIEFCLRPQCKGQSLLTIWTDYKRLWDSLDEKAKSSKLEHEFEIFDYKIVHPAFEI